jgi:hypothetical protein
MIEKLSNEQMALVPSYLSKWTAIGYSDAKLDEAAAKAILLDYVKVLKIAPKEFVFLPSPSAIQKEINARAKKKAGKYEYYGYNFYTVGNINAGYCAFYDFLIDNVKQPDKATMNIWKIFKEVTKQLHYFNVFDDVIFCSERPKIIVNSENKIHCECAPAVKYADGFSMYFINGAAADEDLRKKIEKNQANIEAWKKTNQLIKL